MSAPERARSIRADALSFLQERRRKVGGRPRLTTVVRGYEDSNSSIAFRQRDAIEDMLKADPTGEGKVVVYVDHPIQSKEYADAISTYTAQLGSLSEGEYWASSERSAKPDTIIDQQLSDRLTDVAQVYPGRVQIVVGWQDPELKKSLSAVRAEQKEATPQTGKVTSRDVSQRRANVEEEAALIEASGDHKAGIIAEAAKDPDVLGVVTIVDINDVDITHRDNSFVVNRVLPPWKQEKSKGKNSYLLTPHDLLVRRAIEGTLTDDLVEFAIEAEALQLDARTKRTKQQENRKRLEWINQQKRVRRDSNHGIKEIEAFLSADSSEQAPPFDPISIVTRAFLSRNGIEDPSEAEVLHYTPVVEEWVDKFRDNWEMTLLSRREALSGRIIPSKTELRQRRIARHLGENVSDSSGTFIADMAEREVLLVANRIVGSVLGQKLTNAETLGEEFLLATVMDPEEVIANSAAFMNQDNWLEIRGVHDLAVAYAKVAGSALTMLPGSSRGHVTPKLTRYIAQEESNRQKERYEKAVQFATYRALQLEQGIEKPTPEAIAKYKRKIESRIAVFQEAWEYAAKVKRFDMEDELMQVTGQVPARDMIRSESQKAVLATVNDVSSSAIDAPDMMGVAFFIALLEDPEGVGDKMLAYHRKDPSLHLDQAFAKKPGEL